MKHFLAVCLVLCAANVGFVSASDEPRPGQQQETQLETPFEIEMDYLLYLPRNYQERESWPVLLFLHGAGERGDDLELVKKHGPPKLISEGRDFPFIVVSPQCPEERWWESVELVALLNEVAGQYNVDEDRIDVTGLSMGGFGTWRLAFFAPERLAAIAPICGGGEKYWARRFAHLPVWAFHGAKDKGVPVERSEQMIDALRKNGGKPKFTVYPEAGHDAWTETYDNPELYDWLLKQKREE